MHDLRPLIDRIRSLLDGRAADPGGTLTGLEDTLTDGYAAALELEAERLRIERRLDDPASNGVNSRLDAVLDLQLHEDVRDVVLDRLRADEELARDLGVVLAVRDQLQDLELAVGELGPDRRGGVLVRRLGSQPLQHLGGDL